MKKIVFLIMMTLVASVTLAQTTTTSNTVQTFAANGDTILTTTITTTTISTAVSVVTHKYVPPVVTPPATGTYTPSNPISYNGVNNKTISGLSFDGKLASVDLLTLTNCSNDTIKLCRFANTNGYAIRLENCHNVVIINNYATMVTFFLHAEASVSTKTNYNQGLNLYEKVLYNNNVAHWVQYHNCTGGGQQVNYNRFESIAGVAVNPHDAISIDACSGLLGDSIQCNYNWIRGGQLTVGLAGTGGGIMIGDESGNYQVARGNILVNCGCAGIQSNGTSTNICIDGNLIYSNVKSSVAANGIIVLGTHSGITIKNNRVWWLNYHGNAVAVSDGETSYYFGGSATLPGVTMSNNKWLDATLNSSILPTTIITYK